MFSLPNKLKSLLILSVSLLLFCANCRKDPKPKEIQLQYPEDPTTTTLTPRERLTGLWKVYDYQFKNKTIIKNLDTLYGGKEQIESVDISYDKDLNSVKEVWSFRMTAKYFDIVNKTAFNPDEPYYITIIGAGNLYVASWFITPFFYDNNNYQATAKWKITKLFDKELNLVLETDSGDYKILLKKH